MIDVRYTSPAFPPYGIKLNRIYRLSKNDTNYVLTSAKSEIRMDLEEIKMLFSPVDKTWNEVLETPKSGKK